ncbi:hypothetical protein DSI50_14835, partial [Mycobacterium tuberculosis]
MTSHRHSARKLTDTSRFKQLFNDDELAPDKYHNKTLRADACFVIGFGILRHIRCAGIDEELPSWWLGPKCGRRVGR